MTDTVQRWAIKQASILHHIGDLVGGMACSFLLCRSVGANVKHWSSSTLVLPLGTRAGPCCDLPGEITSKRPSWCEPPL